MAYIGKTPVLGNFVKLDAITVVNGQAAYTMQNGGVNFTDYTTVNQFLVSLNGTIQAATDSFTVSGSTITFASNLSTGDVIDFIIVFGNSLSAGTVSDSAITTAKLADSSVTAAKLASGVGGVAGITSSADATAITIDSSENVGIGTASPATKLDIVSDSNARGIHLRGRSADNIGLIDFRSNDGSTRYASIGSQSANTFSIETNSVERMRINSSGFVGIGATAPIQESLEKLGVDGGVATFERHSGVPVVINRGTNDGELINFRQAGVQEGSVTVSGSSVFYNGFTGTHWSRFQDNSTPTILRGTVLETLDEMCDWYILEFNITTTTQDEDGNDVETVRTKKIPHLLTDGQSIGDVVSYNYDGTDYQATIVKETDIKHMKSKVSDTTDAKNVYGVFSAYDLDGEGYNDFFVASVGSFVVRIKANETIAKGDLLQSNGDGTAKVQTDDAVRSSSFAKVLSTTKIETYDDGSFIVPCSLMC